MNKHSIIGFILIFALFVGYMWWITPSAEERAEMQRQHDSIVLAYNDSVQEAQQRAAERARLDSLARQGDTNAQKQLKQTTHKDMGAFNVATTGDTVVLHLSNGVMHLDLCNLGGRVDKVVLDKYTTYDKMPLELVSPSSDNMNLIFSTEDNRTVETKHLYFAPYMDGKQVVRSQEIAVQEGDSVEVRFRAYAGDSAGIDRSRYVEFAYVVHGGSYKVDFDIAFRGMTALVRNTPYMDFEWCNSMNRQEKVDAGSKGSRMRNKDPELTNTNLYYKPAGDDVDELKDSRDSKKQVKTPVEWVAFKQQFFCAILMSNDTFVNADLTAKVDAEKGAANYLCDLQSTVGLSYDGDRDSRMDMAFYFGPNKFRDLKAMDKGFEKMLPLGWWIFSKAVSRYVIIPVFNFLETFNWNYGIIIIVLTFLMRLVLFPVTFRSYQSSAIMRILKPEMDALNKKYPNQDQMLQKQQEMTRLNKRAGISPMAGCLPMLIQLPILTAMFWFYPASIELRQKGFLWCDDLSSFDSILDLGFNIPLYGDHVSLFCLLMFGMQFFYTWYTMRSQQGQVNMPGMKFMMYFMPFMMLFIFNSQSAGLNIYYFVSLSLTMIQMILIRRFTSEKKIRARMAAYDQKAKNTPQKKSKFQQRLEEMQRMTEEMQRQQQKNKR